MPDFVYPQPIYSNNSTVGKHAGKLNTGDMFFVVDCVLKNKSYYLYKILVAGTGLCGWLVGPENGLSPCNLERMDTDE
jgi:hypothetical protein